MSLYDKASLVLIPSGTKTSKVYSQKPTNGDGDFTFSRSTAATRVNASGNIEKETSNLLLQSNTFDSGLWQSLNTTETGGQAGYDGTNNAWLLSKSAAAARVYQTISISGVQTYSVYAKAGTLNWVAISNNLVYTYFDLANGVIGTDVNTIDSNIESVGGGWYRCSITYTGTATDARVYPSQGDNNSSGTSGNIYIQDAQLEQGLVARDYIETTTTAIYGGITDNVPRLDYTDSSCPALLLEPQRTNLLPHSEYIEGSFTRIDCAAVQNDAISPEGVQNATKVTPYNFSTSHFYYAASLTAGVTYRFSGWYKGTAGEKVYIRSVNTGGGAGDGKLITLTGDWQREDISLTAGTNTSYVYVFDARAGGMTASNFYVYGFQLEVGPSNSSVSYATSYIPTYGSAVTRNNDDFSDNGYQSKGIFGADSGSIFLDFGTEFTIFDGVSNSSPTDLFQFVDITSYGGGYMRFRGGESNHYLQLVSMGAADNSLSFTDQTKYCICWDSNGVDFYGDGALIQSTTITNAPSFDRLERGITGNGREGRVKEVLFFPTKLSSQEAIDLTTL